MTDKFEMGGGLEALVDFARDWFNLEQVKDIVRSLLKDSELTASYGRDVGCSRTLRR